MKEYFAADIKEDCIIFSLTELVTRTPGREVKYELEKYIDSVHKMEGRESDPRLVEIEQCYCKFARLLLEHINADKDLPLSKSYSLNV
jgi:hypothetical protein